MFRFRPWRTGPAGARNHTVSVHLASSTSGRAFHRTLPWWAVRALCAAGVVLILLVVVGIFGLFGWLRSTERIHRLQAENDSLRVQFRRLGDLEDNLDRMSELNDKMQQMLGVDLPTARSSNELSSATGRAPSEDTRGMPGARVKDDDGGSRHLLSRAGKAPSEQGTKTN
jgi:hypothetical protein